MMVRQAFFEAGVSVVKDFIQPILKAILLGGTIFLMKDLDAEANLKVLLGLTYSLIFIFSSFASRIAYRFEKHDYLKKSYVILILALIIISLFINRYLLVITLFLTIQFLQNSRKPIFVAKIDDYIERDDRATVLSAASQLKSLAIIFIAPLLGFIYDKYGASLSIGVLAIILFLAYIRPFRLVVRRKI